MESEQVTAVEPAGRFTCPPVSFGRRIPLLCPAEAGGKLGARERVAVIMVPQGMAQDGKHWHAVHTRSRHEKMVAERFAGLGIEHFLPSVRVLSQWADRRKWVEKALFPGYLFVCIDQEEVAVVRSTRGVARLVGPEPHRPSIVEEEEVENVRRLVSSPVHVDPYPYLKPSRPVRITRGPLRGVEGTLLRRQGRFVMVISVPAIGCSAVAEVPAESVAPA